MTPKSLTVGKTVAAQRKQRAEVLASNFRQWIPCQTNFCGGAKGGAIVWAIPSQTVLGLFHLATDRSCGCNDSRRVSGACKHQLAIRLVLGQFNLRPEARLATRRNGHVNGKVNGYAF